jgi:hypothetical protein
MEVIDGTNVWESKRLTDFFMTEVMSGCFVENKDYKGLDPLFQKMANGETYKKTGLLNYQLKINDVEFESVNMELMFKRMYEHIENHFKKQYENIDKEVEERVSKRMQKFLDKVYDIKDEIEYEDD